MTIFSSCDIVLMMNCLSSVKKKNDPLFPPLEWLWSEFVLKICILLSYGFTDFIMSISSILSSWRINLKTSGAKLLTWISTSTCSCTIFLSMNACSINDDFRAYLSLGYPSIGVRLISSNPNANSEAVLMFLSLWYALISLAFTFSNFSLLRTSIYFSLQLLTSR